MHLGNKNYQICYKYMHSYFITNEEFNIWNLNRHLVTKVVSKRNKNVNLFGFEGYKPYDTLK